MQLYYFCLWNDLHIQNLKILSLMISKVRKLVETIVFDLRNRSDRRVKQNLKISHISVLRHAAPTGTSETPMTALFSLKSYRKLK